MRFLSCKLSLLGKKSYYHQYLKKKIAPNLKVESSTTPQLTIDEVEKVQRQRIASFIGHAFQLTYAALIDKLIQQEKLNRFNGCSKRKNKYSIFSAVILARAWERYKVSLATNPYFGHEQQHDCMIGKDHFDRGGIFGL